MPTPMQRLRSLVTLRFGVRSLLIAVTCLAVALGWWRHRAEQQRLAVAWIESRGGRVELQHEADYKSRQPAPTVYYSTGSAEDQAQWAASLPKPSWLERQLGPHYLHAVSSIFFYHADLQGDVWRLKHAHSLRRLGIVESRLDEKAWEAIGNCRNLQSLSISECECDSQGFAQLATLPKLTVLGLDRVQLEESALAAIGKCTNLKTLDLTFCAFEAEHLSHLSELHKLTHCGLGFTSVGDEQLKVVAAWPKLTRLELGNQVTDACVPDLLSAGQLEHLIFMQSTITDAGLNELLKLPNLQTIQFSKCLISDELLSRISRERPTLMISYVR